MIYYKQLIHKNIFYVWYSQNMFLLSYGVYKINETGRSLYNGITEELPEVDGCKQQTTPRAKEHR